MRHDRPGVPAEHLPVLAFAVCLVLFSALIRWLFGAH